MRSNRRFCLGVFRFHAIILATVGVRGTDAVASTRTWDAGGNGNRWDDRFNWSNDTQPISGDTALLDGAASGVIRLTDTDGASIPVGTLLITQTTANFRNLTAGPGGVGFGAATLNFGTTSSGLTYGFAGSTGSYDFIYGANRTTQGTLYTVISTELAVQARNGQAVRMLSTIVGRGSRRGRS